MKICFPVKEDRGLESHVHDHFGSAPYFLIVDGESGGVTTVENTNQDHRAGRCNPTAAIAGQDVKAVVVGGIGPGALAALIREGIDVFQAIPGTVGENADKVKAGETLSFSLITTCSGKEPGGCGHHH